MTIILAPAKKMRVDTDSFATRDLPQFLDRTEALLAALRAMPPDKLQKLWKCNDSIAALNVERLADMDLRRNLTPALFAYEGIAYQLEMGAKLAVGGYRFCAGESDENTYTFIKDTET